MHSQSAKHSDAHKHTLTHGALAEWHTDAVVHFLYLSFFVLDSRTWLHFGIPNTLAHTHTQSLECSLMPGSSLTRYINITYNIIVCNYTDK